MDPALSMKHTCAITHLLDSVEYVYIYNMCIVHIISTLVESCTSFALSLIHQYILFIKIKQSTLWSITFSVNSNKHTYFISMETSTINWFTTAHNGDCHSNYTR